MDHGAAFYRNYFLINALERYTNCLQEFMLWRRGSFLPPHKKNDYVKKFVEEEQERFHTQGIFSLPSVQFAVTTRCTLRCRDCSVMIPRFGGSGQAHHEMSFAQFRENLDSLLAAVDEVRSLLILGGEPLLHRELADMVAYAASQEKIDLVDVVTNCTIVPSEELLAAIAPHRHKVFFGLSNYTKNPDAARLVRRDEIMALLKAHDIRHSLDTGTGKWFRYSLEEGELDAEALKSVFARCQWHHCLYVFGEELAICPRSLVGEKLGAYSLDEADKARLPGQDAAKLRQKLLAFFARESLDACRYCHRHEELVEPAIQLTH